MVVLVPEKISSRSHSIAASKIQKATLIRNKIKFSDKEQKQGPKEATSCLSEIWTFYACPDTSCLVPGFKISTPSGFENYNLFVSIMLHSKVMEKTVNEPK